MTRRKSGTPEQPSNMPAPIPRRRRAVGPDLVIRPSLLELMKGAIALSVSDMSFEEWSEIARTSARLLADARSKGLGQPSVVIEDVSFDDLDKNSFEVQIKRLPLGNNLDLARRLIDENHPSWAEFQEKHGGFRILAVVASENTMQTGLANSLITLLASLYIASKRDLDAADAEFPEMIEDAERQVNAHIRTIIAARQPDVEARAKQRAALEKAAQFGAATNKARSEKVTETWRQMAKQMWDANPTWPVKKVVHQIHQTAGQIEGRTYSATTIRNAMKGVHRQWRKEFEARKKGSSLYTVDR